LRLGARIQAGVGEKRLVVGLIFQ